MLQCYNFTNYKTNFHERINTNHELRERDSMRFVEIRNKFVKFDILILNC